MVSLPFLLVLLSCAPDSSDPDVPVVPCGALLHPDADGDGYGDARTAMGACEAPEGWIVDNSDCDDRDASLSPETVWWIDADRDGYGAAPGLARCDAPYGYVRGSGDCDDTDEEVSPRGVETCNGYDDDCDGLADDADVNDDVVGELAWYRDMDGDGYGRLVDVTEACLQPEYHAALPTDCDDNDPAIHPGAEEGDCTDPTDYNCDGQVGYRDMDEDGFVACRECDDGEASRYPGAPEVCNSEDDDCDGVADEEEDLIAPLDWYRDADGDRYGDIAQVVYGCAMPEGYAANGLDCDDSDAGRAPNAAEVCDGLDEDEDCDGLAEDDDPDSTEQTAWYSDGDGDGYGDPATEGWWCDAPEGQIGAGGDCDDGDGAVNPGMVELCNGADDDCDGDVDEPDAIDAVTWYIDADGDGAGSVLQTAWGCTAPAGYVAASGDCDDGDGAVGPGAAEVCDGVDNNCDRSVDEPEAVDAGVWYADNDGDGWGWEGGGLRSCRGPAGYLSIGGDCDDARASVRPGAAEVCDGVDNDCDGVADGAGAAGAVGWYGDGDGDGFGDPAVVALSCDRPAGYVSDSSDCDDGAAAVNPGAMELCDALDADEDCDGLSDAADAGVVFGAADRWWADGDGDGWGAGAPVEACAAPAGYAGAGEDCDDTNPAANLGAAEVCDSANTDEDCDGLSDDDDPGADPAGMAVSCPDLDGDGYGDAGRAALRCDLPFSGTAVCTDCDDGFGRVSPAGQEVCDPRGLDEDCDGLSGDADPSVRYDADDWIYPDLDGDGWGGGGGGYACRGAGVRLGGDCDDGDAGAAPDQRERCGDGIDQDCDGADRACAALSTTEAHVGLSGDAGIGAVLAGGADLDGDGFPELLAGAAGAGGGAGLVQGFGLTGEPWDIAPQGSADRLGAAALIADVGGGARAILSAPTADAGVVGGGVVWLLGGAVPVGAATLGAGDDRIGAEQAGDLAGSALSAADTDGDGARELVVGAPGWSSGAGGAWGFAAPTGYTPLYAAGWILTGGASDSAGASLAAVDTDGDGQDEIVVGAPGRGAIYRAIPSGVLSLSLAEAEVVGSGAGFGQTLAAAGDIDGDGLGDVAAGDPSYDDGAALNAGAIWIFRGADLSGARTEADAWITITGGAGDQAGAALLSLPDQDGDGTDELAVGAPGAAGGAGEAWLFAGGIGGALTVDHASLTLDGAGISGFGGAFTLTEIDGDTAPDLAVAASGQLWIFSGGALSTAWPQ